MKWTIAGRTLPIGERTLVMGVLNVTPDSFSDGAQFLSPYLALRHAAQMIEEGADIIDVGGESTRPGAAIVSAEEEMQRVIPVIEALANETSIPSSVPISIDTTKAAVARAALNAGAAIVNDISALRFDFQIADEVASAGAGLVLMHSRGTPATMQRLPPVADIISEVTHSLSGSLKMAERRGVRREAIVEALEPELPPPGIAPQREHVAPAEVADPGLVEEDDGMLPLRLRMLGAEVERVLVGWPRKATARRLGQRF